MLQKGCGVLNLWPSLGLNWVITIPQLEKDSGNRYINRFGNQSIFYAVVSALGV